MKIEKTGLKRSKKLVNTIKKIAYKDPYNGTRLNNSNGENIIFISYKRKIMVASAEKLEKFHLNQVNDVNTVGNGSN